MPAPVRVLFYAINGTGMGHLTRLLAIARAMRELLAAQDVAGDLRFLTTSEATEAVWDFPTYKLPSNTTVAASGVGRSEFLAHSRLLAINLIASLRPDVLVTDTVPQGPFGEMGLLAGHVGATVYVDRHKDPAVTDTDLYRAHLPLYQRILVPDDADQAPRYPLPAELSHRRRFLGRVTSYRPAEALTRQEVRDYFAVPEERHLVYLSAGGGSDSRDELRDVAQNLADDPRLHLLIGYGPLHRGPCLFRPNLTPLLEAEVWRYFRGLDAALSAAGYNSYEELLAARVPTVFFAQSKGMDRQDERIEHGRRAGWHLCAASPLQARAELEALLQGDTRGALLEALERRPAALGALRGAAEILALLAARPTSPLQRQEVWNVALQRAAWSGPDFVEAAQTWRLWERAAFPADRLAERSEQRGERWRAQALEDVEDLVDELRWGLRLHGLDDRKGLVRDWWRAPGLDERERRLRLQDALDALPEGELRELRERHKGEELIRVVTGRVARLEEAENE